MQFGAWFESSTWKPPYDLCMDENRRELYKRNMSQDGLGLAATYEDSGTHKTNAKMLNEHVAHLTRSVDKKIREKEERIRAFLARENEELDALKRAKEVASGDLVGFRDIYNSFNNENSSTMRNLQVGRAESSVASLPPRRHLPAVCDSPVGSFRSIESFPSSSGSFIRKIRDEMQVEDDEESEIIPRTPKRPRA